MEQPLAIALSIILIIGLAAIFVVSFVLYRKTPEPKGIEKMPEESVCAGCEQKDGCLLNLYRSENGKKEEK